MNKAVTVRKESGRTIATFHVDVDITYMKDGTTVVVVSDGGVYRSTNNDIDYECNTWHLGVDRNVDPVFIENSRDLKLVVGEYKMKNIAGPSTAEQNADVIIDREGRIVKSRDGVFPEDEKSREKAINLSLKPYVMYEGDKKVVVFPVKVDATNKNGIFVLSEIGAMYSPADEKDADVDNKDDANWPWKYAGIENAEDLKIYVEDEKAREKTNTVSQENSKSAEQYYTSRIPAEYGRLFNRVSERVNEHQLMQEKLQDRGEKKNDPMDRFSDTRKQIDEIMNDIKDGKPIVHPYTVEELYTLRNADLKQISYRLDNTDKAIDELQNRVDKEEDILQRVIAFKNMIDRQNNLSEAVDNLSDECSRIGAETENNKKAIGSITVAFDAALIGISSRISNLEEAYKKKQEITDLKNLMQRYSDELEYIKKQNDANNIQVYTYTDKELSKIKNKIEVLLNNDIEAKRLMEKLVNTWNSLVK